MFANGIKWRKKHLHTWFFHSKIGIKRCCIEKGKRTHRKKNAWWQHSNSKRSATWAWPIIIAITYREYHRVKLRFCFLGSSTYILCNECNRRKIIQWAMLECNDTGVYPRFGMYFAWDIHRLTHLWVIQRQSCTIFVRPYIAGPFFYISFFSLVGVFFLLSLLLPIHIEIDLCAYCT